MPKRKTKEEFIKQSIEIHGNKYDYSNINYINTKIKVEIFCNKCKIYFSQTPDNHFQGQGCAVCGFSNGTDKRRKTLENFIHDANKIHGEKYDYSKVEYISEKTKIIIKCKIHGEFEQTPGNHLSSKGCPKCSFITISKLKRNSTTKFIENALKIHKNKYDYSNVEYITVKTKINIKCNYCGNIFTQTPNNHLNGKGCILCGAKSRTIKKTKKTSKFIEQSISIHGDKFDYMKVEYIKNSIKIKIICKKHNKEFEQTPANHLAGDGCPICKSSKGELRIMSYLNKNNIKNIRQYSEKNCKNINKLPFDFAIFKNNKLTGLIEYQGAQHYFPVRFAGMSIEKATKNFETLKIRDEIKRKYCNSNNIPFLELKYDEDNKLEENLKIFLKQLKAL